MNEKMRIVLFILFFCLILPSYSFAEKKASKNPIIESLAPYIAEFKTLAEKDAMLARVFGRSVREGNFEKILESLRLQADVRNKEIEHRAGILEFLCKRHGDGKVCGEKKKALVDAGKNLHPVFLNLRTTMANRSLEPEESAGVLKLITDLQKNYMDAQITLIRYYIAGESKHKGNKDNPPLDIFSLHDIPELADIPILPPPPSNKNIRLGK